MKSTFEEQLNQTGRLIYTNVGDSMLPLLKEHRDVLIIERPKEWDKLPKDGTAKLSRLDIPLYKRDSGQYVLHRVLKVRKNDYVICGDNRRRREYGISDRHVIGVLTAVVKDGKEIPVNKGKYRVYAHLWCDFYFVRAAILFLRGLPDLLKRRSQSALTFLWKVTEKKKINILRLLLLQAILGISSVCYALIIREVIDRAVSGSKTGYITYMLFFAGLVAMQIVIRAVIRFLEEYSKSTFENQFKDRLFYTLLTRDYKSIAKIHSGEWMNRLTSDTQIVAEGLTTIVPGIVGMLVRILGAVGMILYFVPEFSFLLVPGAVVFIILTYGFRKVLKRLHKAVQEKDGITRAFMQENIESSMVVRAFAVERETAEKAAGFMKEHKKARIRRNHFSNFCNIGFGAAIQGAYVIGLAYCGYGLLTGTMSYGTLMAILQLISQVQSPVANITGYVPKYYAMIASAERLMEAESYDKTELTYKSKEEVKDFYDRAFSTLAMEHITFSYDKDNPVLSDFSLSIHKGDLVAFTGMSGCGKSTVLKLLLGLYKPDSGTISLDESYRRMFAYVPQGNFLMSGKIRDVVAMANAKDRGNDDKIREVLQIACADFVYELSEGVDTQLGERGLGISEGQMQRIAVARALFSECPILIFDEATSALDAETEKQMLQNIRALTDRTVLIVTHRPAALLVCDRQIVFGEEV